MESNLYKVGIKIFKDLKQYRIKKIGVNTDNKYNWLSDFGDSQPFFQGYSHEPPTIGERFVLRTGKLGGVVIDTSPIVEIREGEILTTYSRYKIEEV